jgi:hypothetical protein
MFGFASAISRAIAGASSSRASLIVQSPIAGVMLTRAPVNCKKSGRSDLAGGGVVSLSVA